MTIIQSFIKHTLLLVILSCIVISASSEDSIPLPYSTTSTRDTLISGDSVIVIHTVCAPVCSSYVGAYTIDGHFITTLYPPFKSPFPEAYIQDGKLLWRDNLPQILDTEEQRHISINNDTTD